MKKIYVNPLKSVNDVNFGEKKTHVRKAFGRYTEGKDNDDFNYCNVQYNEDGTMRSVEIMTEDCSIVVGGKLVDTTNTKTCKRSLNMNENADPSRSISIYEENGKVKSILFGEAGCCGDTKKPEKKKEEKKDEVKKESSLAEFFDDLKPNPSVSTYTQPVGSPGFRAALGAKTDCLKDKCYKHLLLDIYCKITPLDSDYVAGHMGQMKSDVDMMLKSKGCTPTQYMTSAYESTRSPLLGYIIRSVDDIGRMYAEDATETVRTEQERGIDAPMPDIPEDVTDDATVNDQLVDVQKDTEYGTFVDKLKEKTINKIVADISKVITNKKEEQNMVFNPKPTMDQKAEMESTTSIGVQYIQSKLIQENVDISEMTEDILGMAIRESTLNQFDCVFNLPGRNFVEFYHRINNNMGAVINESAVAAMAEEAKTSQEINQVVQDADKEKDKKIDNKLKASEVIKAKNEEDNEEENNQ